MSEVEFQKVLEGFAIKAWQATVYSDQLWGHTERELVALFREVYDLGFETGLAVPNERLGEDT
jgi:hypothetical protein